MRKKLKVYSFLLYYLFALIGPNLYLINTAFSFGNIFLIIITGLVISEKNTLKLNRFQMSVLRPLLAFQILITIHLIYSMLSDANILDLKFYFYLSTIPVLLFLTSILGNLYGIYFYKKVYSFSKFILILLFITVFIEFTTGIHMPAYDYEINLGVPTSFFGNSNDLSVITLLIFIMYYYLNEEFGNKLNRVIIILLVSFILIVAVSRTTIVFYVLFFPITYFLLERKKASTALLTLAILLAIYIAFNFILVEQIPKRFLDPNSWINNRLISITMTDTYVLDQEGSVATRFEIYSYPFLHPLDFILGYGFKGDELILTTKLTWIRYIENAHSFFAEVIYDFGWIGFINILWLMIVLFRISLTGKPQKRFYKLLITLFYTAVLINVPSSIYGKPVIWIPLFIMLSFALFNQQKNKQVV